MFDVVVIGGGPSGMSAALTASANGSKVLLIEREKVLGGILNQCIHNGFGLHYFGEELTGPEYALRLAKKIKASNVEVMLGSFVTYIYSPNKIEVLSSVGLKTINCKALVLAMGSREKTAGAISLAGTRPSGLYTAGLAQKMINHYGKLPGSKAVILGSGDIGLIMARRLTLEGVKVSKILEIMPSSSGLARNVRQCVEDYDIPLLYSHTITKVVGENKVEGIYYAKVDEKLSPIKETEVFEPCDCILLSVGLIPENDLVTGKIEMSPKTKSAIVDEYRQTSLAGVFATGNVLHIHDLADNATIEGQLAGQGASLFAKNELPTCQKYNVIAGEGISYALPQKLSQNAENFSIFFRTKTKLRKVNIILEDSNTILSKQFALAVNPGEMHELTCKNIKLSSDVTIRVEEI